MRRYLWLILLLAAIPATAQGECRGYYDENITQMGIIYRVDITKPSPDIIVCGHWELDGKIAKVPNADLPSSTYCRKTDETGKTFFAYRWRGKMDCTGVVDRLKFIVEN